MLRRTLENRVLSLVIDRPQTRNSLSREIMQSLVEELGHAGENPEALGTFATGGSDSRPIRVQSPAAAKPPLCSVGLSRSLRCPGPDHHLARTWARPDVAVPPRQLPC